MRRQTLLQQYLLVFVFVVVSSWIPFFSCDGRDADGGRHGFLYYSDKDDDDDDDDDFESFVMEYQIHTAPDEDFEQEHQNVHDVNPSILSSNYPNPRIIQFYSPWSGPCQKIKNVYNQLAKDLMGLNIEFHAISCSVHHWLCETHGIIHPHQYPTIRSYPTNSITYVTVEQPPLTLKSILSSLGMEHHDDNSDPNVEIGFQGDVSSSSHIDILGASRDAYQRTQTQVFQDASFSFIYSLKHHIEGLEYQKSKDAFREWMDLLYWTLPTTWKVHTLIVDIQRNLKDDSITTTTTNNVELLHQLIDLHSEVVLGNMNHWTEFCTKGRSTDMSFLCGFWNLLHIMSIGATERHRSVLGDRSRVTTKHIAKTIRDYVDLFLGEECELVRTMMLEFFEKEEKVFSRQQQQQYDDIQEYWKELPIWFWKLHNHINLQLLQQKKKKKEQVTTDEEVQITWPSLNACRTCQSSKNGRRHWNHPHVFDFLKSQYWPSGIHNFRYVVLDKKKEPVEEDSSFSNNIQTLLILGFLLTLIYWILPTMRRNRTGRHKKFDQEYRS